MKKIHLVLIFLYLLTQQVAPVHASELASFGAASTPKAPCRIEIHDAHISTDLQEKKKLLFVKVKAESICDIPQSQVTLTVEIFKTGLFENHLVANSYTKPLDKSSSGFIVKNWNTFALCKNEDKTSYYGIAYSKAYVGNKWMYAGATNSVHTMSLNCGT